MAEEIYCEWFVRMRFPGYERVKLVKNIPVNWKYEKLGNLCSIIKRGISPSYDDNSEMLVINQRCIRNLTPSKDDIAITRQLKSAGETLGIRLLDHIIFSHKEYYSFQESDRL